MAERLLAVAKGGAARKPWIKFKGLETFKHKKFGKGGARIILYACSLVGLSNWYTVLVSTWVFSRGEGYTVPRPREAQAICS